MVNNTIIINKNSEINIKTFKDINLLYKTCLFRKSDNFICQHKWKNIKLYDNLFDIELWGKSIGTKQYINTFYDISNKLNKTFYNSIAFIFYYSGSNTFFNINIDIWNSFFNNYIKPNNNLNKENTNTDLDSSSYTDDDNDSLNNYNDSLNNDNDSLNNDNDSLNNDNDSINNEFETKELTYEPYYFSSDNE
jgi:hypothetical protein